MRQFIENMSPATNQDFKRAPHHKNQWLEYCEKMSQAASIRQIFDSQDEGSWVVLGAKTATQIVSRLRILPLLCLRPLQLGRLCQVLLLRLASRQPLTSHSSPVLRTCCHLNMFQKIPPQLSNFPSSSPLPEAFWGQVWALPQRTWAGLPSGSTPSAGFASPKGFPGPKIHFNCNIQRHWQQFGIELPRTVLVFPGLPWHYLWLPRNDQFVGTSV